MTLEQAINILNPETFEEAIKEFNGYYAISKAVNDACLLACEVMRKDMEKQQRAKDERLQRWKNGTSLTELEKIANEIFILGVQKRRYESINEFPEAQMCEDMIRHLKELLEYKHQEESK